MQKFMLRTFFRGIIFISLLILVMILIEQFGKYNFKIVINFLKYDIQTNLVFLTLVFAFILLLLFYLIGIISGFVRNLLKYQERVLAQNKNNAILKMAESALLLSMGENNATQTLLKKVDKKYLSNYEKDLLSLIDSKSDNGNIPVNICYSLSKTPNLSYVVSKKLANIEFKLGNYGKAEEWAMIYYEQNKDDIENNLTICQILAIREDWYKIDDVISLMNVNEGEKAIFSKFYIQGAKKTILDRSQPDALTLCQKALLINPTDYEAAELFCEIASSLKRHELIEMVLFSSFKAKPDFKIFLLIKNFVSLPAEELFVRLTDNTIINDYPEILLAITASLGLTDTQKDILNRL